MSDTLRSVPAAPGRVPLLGHTPALCRRPLRFLESLHTVGDIVRVDLGVRPVYFVTSPQLIREVLVIQARCFDRGRHADRVRQLFGNGLATSDGELHRRQRRLIRPAFGRAARTGHAAAMERHARALTEAWRPGQVVELDAAVTELVMAAFAEAMFSSPMGRPAVEEMRRSLPVIMRDAVTRAVLPKALDPLPIPVNRRFDAAAARLRREFDNVIARYRAAGADHGDLLSLLLAARDEESGEAMSPEQVRDELVTITVAAAETTSAALSWAFFELGRAPEADRRLHEEVSEAVGAGPAHLLDPSRLAYTGAVLHEVLRLHAIPLSMRRATTAVELGGVHLAEGSEVAFSVYALHRDPRLYPDPHRFDPDRWAAAGRAASLPRGAFIPFGEGNRKCLGDAFARTGMAVVLATVAARWRLRPVREEAPREVRSVSIPRPAGLRMIAVPRGQNAREPTRLPVNPP
ncbi:cytochrome P450 [Streptomyces sp. NPDC053048]|uniref:cytochrome P450 n=1 Tax=Streptomyces sp. NPDC053048 TaxID=3365694 RepID=UPI0037D50BFD